MGVAQIGAVNGGSCTAPCRSVASASTLLCWTQPDRDGASKGLMKASHSNTGPVTRVLIVEDFLAFRRFICSTLGESLDLRVIAEVADGLEAVQKAAELKPDLILLDIGLPTINGIEAARQIRKVSPESKIVFVSQESSPDVVDEALSTGACGYVVKAKAASQLLAVVEAVISGTRFSTALGQSSNSIRRSSLSQRQGT